MISRLDQTAQPQIFLDNDIYESVSTGSYFHSQKVALTIDSSHDESNLRCVSRAGKMLFEINH